MTDQSARPSRPILAKTFDVFRYHPFLLFWIGACISNTGNWTENAAQSWAVTSRTVGNPHQGLFVELLQFADFCPVLILALLAGVISDRVNRKTWLIVLQTAAGVLGAGLAVAAFMGRATPVVVIVFTFLEGIVWALNGPVFLAVVPSLVPKGSLDSALAMNSIQFNMARLCGPMLAAAIIGVAGVAGAFTLNACTFLPLLAVLLFFITTTCPLTNRHYPISLSATHRGRVGRVCRIGQSLVRLFLKSRAEGCRTALAPLFYQMRSWTCHLCGARWNGERKVDKLLSRFMLAFYSNKGKGCQELGRLFSELWM